jgi:RNA polymerase-binding protein DksA
MAIQVRERLRSVRDELARELERDEADLAVDLEDRGEDLTPSQHPADVASDLFTRESVLSMEQRIRHELYEVDDALRRLGRGTYGVCEDCGGRIRVERLEALPQASRCVECQRKEDHRWRLR